MPVAMYRIGSPAVHAIIYNILKRVLLQRAGLLAAQYHKRLRKLSYTKVKQPFSFT